MEAVIVSTTMASVTELFGKFNTPETYRLVEVALVAVRFVTVSLVEARVVKNALVDVTEVARNTVEVMAVPEAEVKYNGPVSVPPASGR